MTKAEAWEILNYGYVKEECEESAINVFCDIVKTECERHDCTIQEGLFKVVQNITALSKAEMDKCNIRPVLEDVNIILRYFVNPILNIPMHIMFWIYEKYGYRYVPLENYTEQHPAMFNALIKEYINSVAIECLEYLLHTRSGTGNGGQLPAADERG